MGVGGSTAKGAAGGAAAGSVAGPWGAAIGGVVGGIGGFIAGSEAEEAAKDAERKAAALREQERARYEQFRNDAISSYSPYAAAGEDATRMYSDALKTKMNLPEFSYQQGQFNFDQFADPGAQYRMDQANKAIQASALAKGGFGGGTAKALQANSQGMASQEFANSFGRFMDTSKMNYGQALDIYDRGFNRSLTTQQDYRNRLQRASENGQAGILGLQGVLSGYGSALGKSYGDQANSLLAQYNLANEAATAGKAGLASSAGTAAGTGLSAWLGQGEDE